MSKRSRPFFRYFLILTAAYFVMTFWVDLKFLFKFPRQVAEGSGSVAVISGEQDAFDLVKKNQEKIPGYMREYVEAVASYKAGEIMDDGFQFIKKLILAGLALNWLMGMIILIWARSLYDRIYRDALEAREGDRKGLEQ